MDNLEMSSRDDLKKARLCEKKRARKKCVAICFVVAAVVTLSACILFHKKDDLSARRLAERSIAENYPHVMVHPLLSNNTDSSLIWYRAYDLNSKQVFVDELCELLNAYKYNEGNYPNVRNCGYDNPPKKGQVCQVDVRNWGNCIEENNFSYHKSSPCIFLELSKVAGWLPEYYNRTSDLPESMPAFLKEHIMYVAQEDSRRLNTIWVSCDGESAVDVEHIGPVIYNPMPGFPGYYYPYENSEGYLSPLVAIQLERPRIGVLISIECRVWARNLHNGTNEVGKANFQVLID